MTPDPEIQSLVRRCLADEPGSWDALVMGHFPFLAGAIRRTLRRYGAPESEDRVQELLQETFLALCRDDRRLLREFRWECPLRHYLAMIAEGRCIDFLRRERPQRFDEAAIRRLASEEGKPLLIGDAERLQAALARLGSRERLAVQWFYWDGLSPDAIASALRLKPGSARSLLTRARESLRRLLKDSLLSILL